MGRCGAFPLRRQEVCVVGCGWRESEHAGACLSLAGEFAQTLEVVFEWMMVLRELEPKIPPRALRVELMEALKAMRAELMANPHDTDVFSEAEIRIVVSNFLASCERSPYPARTAVLAVSAHGTSQEVHLVNEAGHWRVRIPALEKTADG